MSEQQGARGPRANADMVGDERVVAVTGRTREAWFTVLDDAGADAWDHTRIATFLGEEHGVDPWWCQSVTVAYEQARGKRLPGQQRDGSFAAGASKTLPVARAAVEPWLVEAERLARWAGPDVERVSKDGAKVAKVRERDTGVRVSFYLDESSAKDGSPRTRVAAQAEKLDGPEAVADAKERWTTALARLADLV